jgi:hypothetical protein
MDVVGTLMSAFIGAMPEDARGALCEIRSKVWDELP